ncbi:MAG: peptidoglycan DD-metalloendopeptidase family protein [Gallionella sp.]
MLTQNAIHQRRKVPHSRKKLRWFVALSALPLLGVVTAFGLVPQDDLGFASANTTIENIALPATTPSTDTSTSYWRSERILRGDSAAKLFSRMNINDSAASDYLRKSAEAFSFRKLRAGTEVIAEATHEGRLIALRYLNKDGTQNLIKKQNGVFTTKSIHAELEKRVFVRSGEIQSSLFAAADAAEMPDSIAYKLNEIFSGDIDFRHDLRKGDKFTAIYEMAFSNGTALSTGKVLAAEFINRGKVYQAVYFEKDAEHGDYYTPDGKSVQKAFLRSPLEYSRISSGFSRSRLHPVLKKWRSHKGVDFAAPTGTRVKATADGVVSFVGRKGGYGKVVMINHQGRYSTVYGHMSRFAKGLRKGQRVTQGQFIGRVGMTGLATGPHLHYEFKIYGKHLNPMRVALPDAKPIDEADRVAFQKVADRTVSDLNLLRNTNLALLD